MALHFNVRFPEEVVVRNSMTAGQWDSEEREGPFTLQPATDFSIEFFSQQDGYKVISLKLTICQVVNEGV